MKRFTDYKDAQDCAIDIANDCHRDVGIRACKEFGKAGFNVFLLPNKENRRGFELCCEVVTPNTPKSQSLQILAQIS